MTNLDTGNNLDISHSKRKPFFVFVPIVRQFTNNRHPQIFDFREYQFGFNCSYLSQKILVTFFYFFIITF